MFPFLTLFWSRDSCHWSMNKEYHFPNVGFSPQAFLYSVRFLLTHPIYGDVCVECARLCVCVCECVYVCEFLCWCVTYKQTLQCGISNLFTIRMNCTHQTSYFLTHPQWLGSSGIERIFFHTFQPATDSAITVVNVELCDVCCKINWKF